MLPFIFTRPAALWALVLCALPALIYWFRRRQKSVVRWGAMRFLAAAQEKVQRKNRLMEFLILALQTLAVLCVVLASAGMSLKSEFKAVSDSAAASNLWLLDVSDSMNAQWNGGPETRLDAAKRLIPSGQTVIEVSDWRKVPELPKAPISRVTLVSDCPADPHFAAFLTELEEKTPGAAHRLVSVFSPVQNLWVSRLELTRTPALTEGKQTVELAVSNDSASSRDAVLVELALEKKDSKNGFLPVQKGEKWLKIAPNSEASAQWEVTFPEAGEFRVTARLKTRDDFPADDSRSVTIHAKEAARFLISESFQPAANASEATQTEAAPNLRAALSALFSARCPEVAVEKILRVDSVQDADFSALDLAACDAVFLMNPPFFTEAEAQNLRSYVQNGGALWVFPGNQTKPETFAPLADFLPGVVSGEMKSSAEPQSEAENVTPKIPDGPRRVAELFAQNPQSGLEAAPVFQWFPLQPAGDSVVELALSTGEPLLVLKDFGRGRTAIASIPADSRASALPLLPVWVPLVDQTLHFLTSAGGTDLATEESSRLGVPAEPASIPLSWEFRTLSPTETGEATLKKHFLAPLLFVLAAAALFLASILSRRF